MNLTNFEKARQLNQKISVEQIKNIKEVQRIKALSYDFSRFKV